MSSKKPPFDILTIGDSLYDVFLGIHEATVTCQINKEACLLCLEYAEKIPITSVVKVPGSGNASNVAVGSTKLGLTSALISTIGHDDVGKEALAHWKKEKVSTKYIAIDHKHETNYATIINFQGERTELIRSQPRKYALPAIDGAHWIYYTALGEHHEKLERQMMKHLKKHPHIKLAFNPGNSHFHRGLEALKPVIARSEIFIVNKQEAERLLQDGERPMHNLLMAFTHIGAKIVVITDGPNGSYATDGQMFISCPIFPGRIVGRTGAGDSYTTGFLCALHHGKHIHEAMRWGTANAWNVVQHIGPQKGLLDLKSMKTVLQKFKKIQPKQMQ